MDKSLFLQRVRLFRTLSRDELVTLAVFAEALDYAAGDPVIEDGAPGTHLFVVVSGVAEVRKDDRCLARLGQGDCFGEMALVDSGPRSAAVVMAEAGVLLRLHRDVFRDLVRRHPEMYEALYGLLAERLRAGPAGGRAGD